jgi:hypothetical protein
MSMSRQIDTASPTPTDGDDESRPQSTLSTVLSFTQGIIPLLVAIIILWYFGTALKRMFGLTGPAVTETEWGRNVYLYGGLEALAFAAAGFLFGREVNRQRAERAERHADSAQRDANSARNVAATNAANGRALAEGVRAFAGVPTEEPTRLDAATPARGQADLQALRRMADTMFPGS